MARFRRNSGSSPEPEPTSDEVPLRSSRRRKNSSEETEIRTSDRQELISCIKRGQQATWVPNPNLEALRVEAHAQAEARSSNGSTSSDRHVSMEEGRLEGPASPSENLSRSERQPSAFHSGDFEKTVVLNGSARRIPTPSRTFIGDASAPQTDSPPPWPSPFSLFHRTVSDPAGLDLLPDDRRNRSRAPSIGSSLSSSYVMRPPTSPLVHATSNLSINVPDAMDRNFAGSSGNASNQLTSLFTSTPPGLRRETTVPMRNHPARRSLTSFTYQPASTASTVYPSRQRRLSHASDTHSIQRSSMIGSFEESILRGRMSTAPSHPLQFVAKIGVSGRGACPPKLKCPAHVTVPFPAVFYNYPSSAGARSISDDSPSPYVGTINLREHLDAPEERRPRKRQSLSTELDVFTDTNPSPNGSPFSIGTASPVVKSTIGGAYRVPQQGQLQIILKNPENTAVKLFLVPYDLDGMLPDSKTFVRQRSFSTGPIAENVLSGKPIQDPLSEKQVLRYTIHLKFCCIGKGKFYLYDNIRVVFASRVPDGKEQLKNEIQLPEPRYSPLSLNKSQPSSRRQSGVDGYMASPSVPRMDAVDGLLTGSSPLPMSPGGVPFRLTYDRSPTPLLQEHVKSPDAKQPQVVGTSHHASRPNSPEYGFERASISQRSSPVPWGTAIDLQPRSPSPAFNGDGLLSKKLRELSRQNTRTSLADNDDMKP